MMNIYAIENSVNTAYVKIMKMDLTKMGSAHSAKEYVSVLGVLEMI